ncbi:hypothetical protein L3Q67_26065 [Saccharothrix sp. AJ9571]|nr:hypothetical protein L3Q67_26065 [Saccharothrix sp. AJ9571]
MLCDRYLASSLVLQALDNLFAEQVWQLNHGIYRPDLAIILTGNPATIKAPAGPWRAQPVRTRPRQQRPGIRAEEEGTKKVSQYITFDQGCGLASFQVSTVFQYKPLVGVPS